jgi:PrtD family type I secretion system ABC transporter
VTSSLTASPLNENPLHTALRRCAGAFGLIFAYSCGYNLLLLATPVYLLQLYDRVLASRSVDTLIMLTAIVVATVAVGGLLDALRRAALGRIGGWLDEQWRPQVLSAGLDCAARGDGGRATQAYRDVAAVTQFLGSGACAVLFDLLWSPLFFGVLFLIDPLLGFAGAASVLAILALALVGELATERHLARVGLALARSHERLGTVAAKIDLLKALGATESAKRWILEDGEEAAQEQRQAQRRAEVVMLITKPVRALTQVLIMGLAAWLVLQHDKSPAIIFAGSLLFGRGMAPVEGAIAGWKAYTLALSAFRRLEQLPVARNPDPAVPSEIPDGPLVLENVSLTIPGMREPVLKSISLRLEPGECLGVIGLSGSGKSMLGRVMAGLVAPTQGHAGIAGIALQALHAREGARLFGYMPQEIDLVGRTAAEIIGRLGGAATDEVISAAKLAGMHETIVRLPRAYESDIGEANFLFLRGFRQRLGFARAVCGNPSLVVLDEPNASLDFPGEQMLFDAVQKMKASNSTVVIITHRTGILAATDKIAILQGGALIAFGSRDEIVARYLGRSHVEPSERTPARLASAERKPTAPKAGPKTALRRPRRVRSDQSGELA